jgi:Fe-S oxidoreductase/nitrate reductase gamma subunit
MSSESIPLREDRLNFRSVLISAKNKIWDFFVNAIAQIRIYQKPYAGVMHALIFWGVTIQVIGTVINLMQMQLFIPFVELPFPRNGAYFLYELFMDMAGIAILFGVLMAAIRRALIRPKTLETQWDDIYALSMLALIPLAGFTLEASRLIASNPPWVQWSPVGILVAQLFINIGVTPETAENLHIYLLITHIILGLALVASIPFTKFRHLVTTPLNILLRPSRKSGTLEKIEDIEETEILGVGKITEFTQSQLISFDACVQCGRCEEVCPATICGMAYTPKTLVQSLRRVMQTELVNPNGNSPQELLGYALPEELPWTCTTCGSCLSECPAFVNPVDEIIDLRRYQTLTTGKIPKSVADTLRNMERQGNPWGMPPEDRLNWAKDLNVRELMPGDETDVLLFIGCAFAYDDRNKKVVRSLCKILEKAGVDYAVLGLDEMCCGETARRLGHEYLFQMFAEQNIEVFSQVKFNKIITQCPHCFNHIKNEYPQMGGKYEVMHYTQYLTELPLPWEAISKNGDGISGTFTYHDSCYLGRYNQLYKEPRRLLENAKVETVEMARREEHSLCCGGGGGQMWMETDAETRINQVRLQDAIQVGADTLSTACPYCLLMFDDAIRSKGFGDSIQVMDIAEILEKRLMDSEV